MPAEVSAIRAGELKEIRAHGPRDTAVRGRMKAPRPSLREGLAVIEVDLASVAEHAGIRGRARSRARIVELGPRGDVVRPHGLAEFLCRGVTPPERVQVPGAVNVDGRGTVSVHDWIVRRPDGHGRCPRLRDVIEVRHVGEEVRREPLKADVRALAGRAVDRGWLGDVPEDRLIVPDAHTVIRSLDARARVEIRRRGPHVFRGGARWVGPCGEYKEYGYEEREGSPHAARAGHGHFQPTKYRHLSLRPPHETHDGEHEIRAGDDHEHVYDLLHGRRRSEGEERGVHGQGAEDEIHDDAADEHDHTREREDDERDSASDELDPFPHEISEADDRASDFIEGGKPRTIRRFTIYGQGVLNVNPDIRDPHDWVSEYTEAGCQRDDIRLVRMIGEREREARGIAIGEATCECVREHDCGVFFALLTIPIYGGRGRWNSRTTSRCKRPCECTRHRRRAHRDPPPSRTTCSRIRPRIAPRTR